VVDHHYPIRRRIQDLRAYDRFFDGTVIDLAKLGSRWSIIKENDQFRMKARLAGKELRLKAELINPTDQMVQAVRTIAAGYTLRRPGDMHVVCDDGFLNMDEVSFNNVMGRSKVILKPILTSEY
jgi:hypothetical protein